jgi:hypothetical protein
MTISTSSAAAYRRGRKIKNPSYGPAEGPHERFESTRR